MFFVCRFVVFIGSLRRCKSEVDMIVVVVDIIVSICTSLSDNDDDGNGDDGGTE
jgi:hypothetical protein